MRNSGLSKPVILFAVLFSVVFFPGGQTARAQERPGGPYNHPETGISFPVRLGPFTLIGVQKYDDPGLGTAVKYQRNETLNALTLYLYDLGLKDIPSGNGSAAVSEQFSNARNEVRRAKEMGYYQEVELLYEDNLKLETAGGPLTFSLVCFSITTNNIRHKSYLLVTGYGNQFLKIRSTFPEELQEEGDRSLSIFLEELGRLMK